MTCYEVEKTLEEKTPEQCSEIERLSVFDHLRTCSRCKPIYLKRLRNGIQLMIDAGNMPKTGLVPVAK